MVFQGLSEKDIEEMLAKVKEIPRGPKIARAEFSVFQKTETIPPALSMDALGDVPLVLEVELGAINYELREILELSKGSVVRLGALVGEQAEIYINGCRMGRGEIVVINDAFGVKISQLHGSEEQTSAEEQEE